MKSKPVVTNEIDSYEALDKFEDDISKALSEKVIDLYEWELLYDEAAEQVKRLRKEAMLNHKSNVKLDFNWTDGEKVQSKGIKKKEILTTSGKITIQYKSFYCAAKKKTVSPDWLFYLDSVTPVMNRRCVRLSAEMPYQKVSDLLFDEYNIEISETTLQHLTNAAGKFANEQYLENIPEYTCCEKDYHIIQVDGSMIPMKKGWEEVKTAVIAKLDSSKNHHEEKPLLKNRVFHSTKSDISSFERDIKKITNRMNISDKRLIVMGDGAVWIWKMYERLFPKAIQVLDFYHVAEHISLIVKTIWGENSVCVPDEIKKLCHQVKYSDEGSKYVQNYIERHINNKSLTPTMKETLKKQKEYFIINEKRMLYATYRHKNMPIGTGLIESTQKWLIQARMKQSGMHWSVTGARRMLALRVLLANKRFNFFFRKSFRGKSCPP